MAYASWYHWICGRTQRKAATINQLACPSYSLYVQLLWYSMYYPGGMKAQVSPVQWSKPHSILAPTQDSNLGGQIQNHKQWPLHYHCTHSFTPLGMVMSKPLLAHNNHPQSFYSNFTRLLLFTTNSVYLFTKSSMMLTRPEPLRPRP